LKSQFIEKTKDLQPRSKEFQRILGLTLGFPPKAVEYFLSLIGTTGTYENDLFLDYCGVVCLSNINDLAQNASWLWDRYPVGIDELKVSFSAQDVERISIPYGDFGKIKEVMERKKIIHT
jgi:hypothetical protein